MLNNRPIYLYIYTIVEKTVQVNKQGGNLYG